MTSLLPPPRPHNRNAIGFILFNKTSSYSPPFMWPMCMHTYSTSGSITIFSRCSSISRVDWYINMPFFEIAFRMVAQRRQTNSHSLSKMKYVASPLLPVWWKPAMKSHDVAQILADQSGFLYGLTSTFWVFCATKLLTHPSNMCSAHNFRHLVWQLAYACCADINTILCR